MATNYIEDRSGHPAIIDTRIFIDDVLMYLLDPIMTEPMIAKMFSLTLQQVAAARAYILANPDTTLARHLEIESRPKGVNPPEVIERIQKAHETLVAFRTWLADRRAEADRELALEDGHSVRMPSFSEWLAEQESHQVTTS